MKRTSLLTLSLLLALAGCHHTDCGPGGCGGWWGKRNQDTGPGYDRPFPIGQVTDAFWETQETNAEAADFVFFDHEFRGDTTELGPLAKRHLEQVALRIDQVPFPIVIEESPHNARPDLDQARRQKIVEQLARLGVLNVNERVIVANSFNRAYTDQEAEATYYNGIMNGSFNGGAGRRFGGFGGAYR